MSGLVGRHRGDPGPGGISLRMADEPHAGALVP